MALIDCDEQLEAKAARVNDVATLDPLDGLLTITAPNAWAARINTNEEGRASFRLAFI
jgi:hypothetical protein